MEGHGIAPAKLPPVKIKVARKLEEKNFIEKLWQ
jgi:hypothetical protein